MNDGISILVKSVFQKESLHDCTIEELQTIARQYPYFSPAQLLLAEKLKSADENLYKEQMQKLSLYFNNPLWLDYLANGHESKIIVEPPVETIDSLQQTTAAEEINKYSEGITEQEASNIESSSERLPVEETAAEPASENIESHQEEITIEENQGQPETLIEEALVHAEAGPEIAEPIEEFAHEQPEENLSSFNDLIAEQASENTEAPQESVPVNTESEYQSPESAQHEITEPPIAIPSLPDLKQEPPETELTFEPYHTVDYFASQGIKYVPEEKPADRFGQQLKSFTEWLKAMKRLPETESAKAPDPVLEGKVQQLADHSIAEGEIVTETMAEVWLKQGNKQKAIETYDKLSLLNPAKSAYFASLIEQVKNS
jgi:hypothetical protein